MERGEAKSYTSAAHLAMLYSALDERERALDLVEQDYREGDAILWVYYRDGFFDALRHEPRFQALLRKHRLPETESPAVEEKFGRPRERFSAGSRPPERG